MIGEDIFNVTVRDVNVAFRKRAKVVHPDRAGAETTAAFQKLKAAHEKLKDYLNKQGMDKYEIIENDDEELFFKHNFEHFNFPFENNGCFTVAIEDSMADTWQEFIGEPRVVKNDWGTECDRSWKVKYAGIEITLHIYNIIYNNYIYRLE